MRMVSKVQPTPPNQSGRCHFATWWPSIRPRHRICHRPSVPRGSVLGLSRKERLGDLESRVRLVVNHLPELVQSWKFRVHEDLQEPAFGNWPVVDHKLSASSLTVPERHRPGVHAWALPISDLQ